MTAYKFAEGHGTNVPIPNHVPVLVQFDDGCLGMYFSHNGILISPWSKAIPNRIVQWWEISGDSPAIDLLRAIADMNPDAK